MKQIKVDASDAAKGLRLLDNVLVSGIENVQRIVTINKILNNQDFSEEQGRILCKTEDIEHICLMLNSLSVKGAGNCENLLWLFGVMKNWLENGEVVEENKETNKNSAGDINEEKESTIEITQEFEPRNVYKADEGK